MCYNQNVNVKIDSRGDGWSDLKTAEGRLVNDGKSIKLCYVLDGDECALVIRGGKITQTRRGNQFVDIAFVEGRTTSCTVGCCGFTGSFEVFTEKADCVFGEDGLRLDFDYLSGAEKERIKLTLTAVKNLRGKI